MKISPHYVVVSLLGSVMRPYTVVSHHQPIAGVIMGIIKEEFAYFKYLLIWQ